MRSHLQQQIGEPGCDMLEEQPLIRMQVHQDNVPTKFVGVVAQETEQQLALYQHVLMKGSLSLWEQNGER